MLIPSPAMINTAEKGMTSRNDREKRDAMSMSAPIGRFGGDQKMTKLYQFLIQLREEEAKRRGVPPYMVFETGVLEKLARIRPTSEEAFRGKGHSFFVNFFFIHSFIHFCVYIGVPGVGEVKGKELGKSWALKISRFCHLFGLSMDWFFFFFFFFFTGGLNHILFFLQSFSLTHFLAHSSPSPVLPPLSSEASSIYRLFHTSQNSLKEVSEIRELSIDQVAGHLLTSLEGGYPLDVKRFEKELGVVGEVWRGIQGVIGGAHVSSLMKEEGEEEGKGEVKQEEGGEEEKPCMVVPMSPVSPSTPRISPAPSPRSSPSSSPPSSTSPSWVLAGSGRRLKKSASFHGTSLPFTSSSSSSLPSRSPQRLQRKSASFNSPSSTLPPPTTPTPSPPSSPPAPSSPLPLRVKFILTMFRDDLPPDVIATKLEVKRDIIHEALLMAIEKNEEVIFFFRLVSGFCY